MYRKPGMASGSKLRAASSPRGVTLIDTVVGTALLLVVFVGIASAFRLGVDIVTNNKARAGAIALANERMEYLRSLPYTSLGTVGGIPSGSLAQSETLTYNGVTYTRRTLIEYVDDAKDGTGAADSNGILEDYKAAKVDVSWISRTGTRDIILVSRFETANGMETSCTPPCGNLTVNAVNASGVAIANAQVTITNASSSPTVSLTTYTNASGTAPFIGAPAASNYSVVVTKSGYSSAQTYSATAQNTNPSPANLTVSNNVTTAATFAIDLLGQLTINTLNAVKSATTTDTYVDSSLIATSSNITVGSGVAALASGQSQGSLQSTTITPSNLNTWGTVIFTDTRPAGSAIVYRVYDGSGTLIPDTALSGNAAGFTSSSINLTGLSTSTYPGVRLGAALTTTGTAPSIDAWNLGYTYGPTPLPLLTFALQGAKTIGSGPSGTIYKYSTTLNSGNSGTLVLSGLEWDSYTATVNGTTTNYDISEACAPQPTALPAGGAVALNLFFMPHTVNSLVVDVRAAATGAYISNATVALSRTGFSSAGTTDTCGQTFFSGLTSGSAYTVAVSATGYTTSTTSNFSIGGQTRLSIALN